MDNRYETFLKLTELMNYRKTAQELHLTQPAVTRQIQSLEEELGVKLFEYDRRRLTKTASAKVLEEYIVSFRKNYENLRNDIIVEGDKEIRIGATKTVGDYCLTNAVGGFLSEEKSGISVYIDNTRVLLEKLKSGEIDFAIVEGIFEKELYESRLLCKQNFTGICSEKHPFAGRTVTFDELFDETVVVREKGSGTRDIFEREIINRGYTLKSFKRCAEISSFRLIEELVARGLAVSFTYQAVHENRTDIATFKAKGFRLSHEFNVVWLKNTKLLPQCEEFLQRYLY